MEAPNRQVLIDIAIRNSSLVLFSILIGLAIQFGIEKITAPGAPYSVLANFATFLITAIRFYHGNSIYHENPRIEHPGRFMFGFYSNIITLIALCIIARFINQDELFLFSLLALSIIDIIWALVSASINRFRNSWEFLVWGTLNLLTAILVGLFINFSWYLLPFYSYTILGAYISVALLDYILCRKYYFA